MVNIADKLNLGFDAVEQRLKRASALPFVIGGATLFVAGVALRTQQHELAGQIMEAASVVPLEAGVLSHILHIENEGQA